MPTYAPDDPSPAAVRSNLLALEQDLESDMQTTPDDPMWHEEGEHADTRLTALEVIYINAIFYRFEMCSQRPSPTTAVDCTQELDPMDPPLGVDVCRDHAVREARAVFSLVDRTPEVQRAINQYDVLCALARHRAEPPHTYALPRDPAASRRRVLGKGQLTKWTSVPTPFPRDRYARPGTDAFCPKAASALGGEPAHLGSVMNENHRPFLHPSLTDDMEARRVVQARTRMVAVVRAYRRLRGISAKTTYPAMLWDMRARATLAARLWRAAAKMMHLAAPLLHARRSAPPVPSALSTVVDSNDGEALAEALLPYLPHNDAVRLSQTCHALRAWARAAGRHLQLRLENWSRRSEEPCLWTPHAVGADGTLVVVRHNRVRLQPAIVHAHLTHVFLPKGETPSFLLEQRTTRLAKPGAGVALRRCALRVTLVMDDAARTPVPRMGTCPTVVVHQPSGRLHESASIEALRAGGVPSHGGSWMLWAAPNDDLAGIPKLSVSCTRLSRQFDKEGRTRFRLRVEMAIVLHSDQAGTEAAMVRGTPRMWQVAETPPFCIVDRLRSAKSCDVKLKYNRTVWKDRTTAHVEHVRSAQLSASEARPEDIPSRANPPASPPGATTSDEEAPTSDEEEEELLDPADMDRYVNYEIDELLSIADDL